MSLATVGQLDAWANTVGITLTGGKQAALDSATAQLHGACGRVFTMSPADGGVDEERAFDGNDEPVVIIDDLLTVATVELDGTAIEATAYELHGGPPYMYLVRGSSTYVDTPDGNSYSRFAMGLWPQGNANVTVTGLWGYAATVPADVVEACCMLAACRLLGGAVWSAGPIKRTSVLSVTVDIDSNWRKEREAEALALVRRYRRPDMEPHA